MPVLKFNIDFFAEQVKPLTLEEARELLFRLKCETDILESEEIEIEVNPDRPDMYSIEGIRRALHGIAGIEFGWKEPPVRDSGLVLRVGDVPQRPFIAAAVVYNVNIDSEDYLKQLIQFQEKLHDTIGRRRRKVAIGFHDLEKMPGKSVEYKLLNVREARFKPLGLDEERTAAWVLESTEQGRSYGRLSLGESGEHPFLLAGGEIIAMPPVINSNLTRVEVGTRHLFIDVTGTSKEYVEKVLDIIVSNLVERKGATIGEVKTISQNKTVFYPLLRQERVELNLGFVREVMGYYVTKAAAARALEMMRFNIVGVRGSKMDSLLVAIPPFRADYIAPIDLVEDIAMAIGYDRLYPLGRPISTRGSFLSKTRLYRAVRELLVGLGFTEVLQLTLISPTLAGFSERKPVEIKNPVQYEYSVLRTDILLSLLQVLKDNQHVRKPIRIFEIGKVAFIEEGNIVENDEIGLAIMDDETSVEEIQSPLYALLESLEVSFKARSNCTRKVFLKGRCGTLLGETGEAFAEYGEIDPSVLEQLGIEYPIAAAVIDGGVLLSWRSRMRGLE